MGLGIYTESQEKRRLSGTIEKRGTQTGTPTLGMFLFGLPFVGVGIFVALTGLKVVPTNPASVHGPYWLLVAFGAVFALGGLMLWGMAGKQFRANRRRVLSRENHVNDPALEDYPWDPRGYHSHCWTKTAKWLGGAGFLSLFLSMFNWWAWFAPGPWPVKIIVSLFDVILVFVWWQAAMTLSRAIRFGDSRIEFVGFPYRANGPIRIRWITPRGITRAEKGTFTLRCIKEWTETTGVGENRSQDVIHEAQWSGVWTLDHAENFPEGNSIELTFQPTAALPVTSLSGKATVYWELEIALSLPGPDFRETYLVPVY